MSDNPKVTCLEKYCAEIALEIVKSAGGSVTFEQYDDLMFKRQYPHPINWIDGWGLCKITRKKNNDKLCAFTAIKLGMLKRNNRGYEVVK